MESELAILGGTVKVGSIYSEPLQDLVMSFPCGCTAKFHADDAWNGCTQTICRAHGTRSDLPILIKQYYLNAERIKNEILDNHRL